MLAQHRIGRCGIAVGGELHTDDVVASDGVQFGVPLQFRAGDCSKEKVELLDIVTAVLVKMGLMVSRSMWLATLPVLVIVLQADILHRGWIRRAVSLAPTTRVATYLRSCLLVARLVASPLR